MHSPKLFSLVFVSLAGAVACGGSTIDTGAFDHVSSNSSTDAGTASETSTSGSAYEVHLRATQNTFVFDDDNVGETPNDQHLGVRKLTLYRDANDASPVVVFDNGKDAIEAGLNDGDDTIVGHAGAFPAGAFTLAHLTVGYYRFKVDGMLHSDGVATHVTYSDIEVLTDGTVVDGTVQNQGHYSYTIEIGGNPSGTVTGEDLATSADLAGHGLSLVTANREVDYVFPVNVTFGSVPPGGKLVLSTNTYENFRWKDKDQTDYETGNFDTTPSTTESVVSYGLNSLTFGLE